MYDNCKCIHRMISELGSGNFGIVHKAKWTKPNGRVVDVAVKTLKPGASEKEKVKFLQEAAIMGQFTHANVVKLYGVVRDPEQVSII